MGEVYADFERELHRLGGKYAAHPRRETIRLLLLALEREQLVTTGYREDVIAECLAAMPIGDAARDVIRHALLWVWKDEEMHTIYVRGALLKLGSLRLRVSSTIQQLTGWIGGWASSVQHHVRWRDAPLSRLFAALFTAAGALIGKVPRAVARELRFGSFGSFCRFNVDAERTAALCWKRLCDLAAEHENPHTPLAELERIRDDEERHERLFALFTAALDEKDGLRPGVTAATLAAEVAAVGEPFLPRALRTRAAAENPLGSGGPVWVMCGERAEDKLPLFRRLLDAAGLRRRLEECARAGGKPIGELRVAIKPSFMLGYHRKDRSCLTDPALVRELARYLRAAGAGDVAVVESPNIYDQFYRHRSVPEVARYFDIPAPEFRLVDLGDDQVPHAYGRGMAQYSVGRTWRDADFRISFAKLRSHPVEHVHLSVANTEGLGMRCDHFLFAERQAQRESAVMTLLGDFPPHFALIRGRSASSVASAGTRRSSGDCPGSRSGVRRPPSCRAARASRPPCAPTSGRASGASRCAITSRACAAATRAPCHGSRRSTRASAARRWCSGASGTSTSRSRTPRGCTRRSRGRSSRSSPARSTGWPGTPPTRSRSASGASRARRLRPPCDPARSRQGAYLTHPTPAGTGWRGAKYAPAS